MPKAEKPSARVGFPQAIRDVLIASMKKGQFPLALLGLLLITMVARMPPADVSRLVFEIFAGLRNGCLVGYALAGVLVIGWRLHAKWQRSSIQSEMERLSDFRNDVQKQELGDRVKSSKPRQRLKPPDGKE